MLLTAPPSELSPKQRGGENLDFPRGGGVGFKNKQAPAALIPWGCYFPWYGLSVFTTIGSLISAQHDIYLSASILHFFSSRC